MFCEQKITEKAHQILTPLAPFLHIHTYIYFFYLNEKRRKEERKRKHEYTLNKTNISYELYI